MSVDHIAIKTNEHAHVEKRCDISQTINFYYFAKGEKMLFWRLNSNSANKLCLTDLFDNFDSVPLQFLIKDIIGTIQLSILGIYHKKALRNKNVIRTIFQNQPENFDIETFVKSVTIQDEYDYEHDLYQFDESKMSKWTSHEMYDLYCYCFAQMELFNQSNNSAEDSN